MQQSRDGLQKVYNCRLKTEPCDLCSDFAPIASDALSLSSFINRVVNIAGAYFFHNNCLNKSDAVCWSKIENEQG